MVNQVLYFVTINFFDVYSNTFMRYIEPNSTQKKPDESPKVAISQDIDVDVDLEIPNSNIDRPPKQKLCFLNWDKPLNTNINETDSEWRKNFSPEILAM